MSRPDIAFDATPLQKAHRFRGIGTYVRGLATRLAAQTDLAIEFWSLDGAARFEAPPPHRIRLLQKFPSPQYRGAWLFAQLAMRQCASRSEVRAVHVTDPEALTPLARHKLLATVYDVIPLKEGISPRRLIAWAGYRTYLRALPHASTLFAISQHTADDLVQLLQIPPDRIVVAPPGIDQPAGGARPIVSTRPYFLFLGGPNPNKNLDVLLDAMATSHELAEELLVVGRWLPRQITALQARLRTQGLSERVRHLGFVPAGELPALMRCATALVVASLDEGFGLPVGEGLAAGAVVIHSRIPVLQEISAGSALIFNPRSAEELAACLRSASKDARLRDDLRARGRVRARELTWDAAVARTLAAYSRLLET